MSPGRLSGALLETLGERGSASLIEILDAQQQASTEAAMVQCGERFERRLIEETSKLPLETTQLRGEMREGFADLRRDMADLRAGLSSDRFDLLRWAFAFWIGQVAAISAIVGLLLRTLPLR